MLQRCHISTASERKFQCNPSVVLLVVIYAAAAGDDIIGSKVPQAYIGRYVGRSGMGVIVVRCADCLYGEMRLCSSVDVG